MMETDFTWETDFPSLRGHTSVSHLKQCRGFRAAKQGSIKAALSVAAAAVKPNRINELRERYPSAVLLPVRSRNKLPEAFARIIGQKMCLSVREEQTFMKKLSAMERLFHKPRFHGTITRGEDYIIVDDIVTQGGTVSALRKFVLSKGGAVVAVTALAYSAGSGVIAPDPEKIRQLVEKFGTRIYGILRSYGIAGELREMTDSQVKYLLRFKNEERLVKKMDEYSKRSLCD